MIVGLVLAGGRSSRFGREKALAVLGDRPFIAHVVAVLAKGCEHVAISARAGSLAADYARAHGLACLADAPEDPDGPLAGIKAGLGWAGSQGACFLATAPCDTPFLPGDLVSRLATEGGAAMVHTRQGLQPLCALWPVAALDQLTKTLSSGEHPAIKVVLARLGAKPVAFDQAELFDNLNTPADYRAALTRAVK